MDFSSSEISFMIFERVVRDDIEQFPLNHQMLAVFMELDGKTPLNLVAQRVGLNMGTLREVIAKLMKNGLIAKMEKDVVTVDKEFFDYLMAHLSLAIGPVAQVLIEDEIHNLGYKLSRFPGHRAPELVDNLAREVRRAEKKAVFLKMMAAKIREKRYLTV